MNIHILYSLILQIHYVSFKLPVIINAISQIFFNYKYTISFYFSKILLDDDDTNLIASDENEIRFNDELELNFKNVISNVASLTSKVELVKRLKSLLFLNIFFSMIMYR